MHIGKHVGSLPPARAHCSCHFDITMQIYENRSVKRDDEDVKSE